MIHFLMCFVMFYSGAMIHFLTCFVMFLFRVRDSFSLCFVMFLFTVHVSFSYVFCNVFIHGPCFIFLRVLSCFYSGSMVHFLCVL